MLLVVSSFGISTLSCAGPCNTGSCPVCGSDSCPFGVSGSSLFFTWSCALVGPGVIAGSLSFV